MQTPTSYMLLFHLNIVLTVLVDLCCSFDGRVSPGSSGLSVAVIYKMYLLNVS